MWRGRLGRPADAKQGGTTTGRQFRVKLLQRSDVIVAVSSRRPTPNCIHTASCSRSDVFGVNGLAAPRRSLPYRTGHRRHGAILAECSRPLIYPSPLFGMDNISTPATSPRALHRRIHAAAFELITKSSGVVIRPWLQAFPLAHQKRIRPSTSKCRLPPQKKKAASDSYSGTPPTTTRSPTPPCPR